MQVFEKSENQNILTQEKGETTELIKLQNNEVHHRRGAS
jgi:hypothetical protein